MKRTKGLRVVAFLAALALIAGLAWMAFGLLGNPVSKWLCTRSAETYLEERYPGYTLERVTYSFKDGSYHAFATFLNTADRDFSISLDWLGRVRYDTHESDVLERGNTRRRLEQDYRALVDGILKEPYFSLPTDICYGELIFAHDDVPAGEDQPDYAIPKEELRLGGLYDIRELGARAGHLVIYVDHPDVSPEQLAVTLLTIRDRMDRAGGGFRAIDLVLREPKPDTEGPWERKRTEVRNFAYADIYDEGLLQRVEAAIAETEAYYARLDQEK